MKSLEDFFMQVAGMLSSGSLKIKRKNGKVNMKLDGCRK
jgi:hypothetical protein